MNLREFLTDFYLDIVLDKLSQKDYGFIRNFDNSEGFYNHLYHTLEKINLPCTLAQDELEQWLYERLEDEAEDLADIIIDEYENGFE